MSWKNGPLICKIRSEKGAWIVDKDNKWIALALGDTTQEAEDNKIAIIMLPELYNALKAAMNYIDECACDPDTTPNMWKAWSALQALKPKELLDKLANGPQD